MGRLKKTGIPWPYSISWCESTTMTEGQGTCRKANNHNYWAGIIMP